jgi:hypothetical protein
MTTLHVRDQSGYREAQPTDVLDRAQALPAQRYNVGFPVLTSPALTRDLIGRHVCLARESVIVLTMCQPNAR